MIFSENELPAEGVAQERLTLEFKVKLEKQTFPDGGVRWPHFEMAKDAAAMANAYGGTLLIGAQEYPPRSGNLRAYVPLTKEEANEIVTELQKAISQRCIPCPVHDVVTLPKGTGFVVAANVWAFPDQAIGVRVAADKNDGSGGAAYVFPLRTATNTTMIDPTHLPLLIHAASRRAAVLLLGIPKGEPVRLYYGINERRAIEPIQIEGVSPRENVVRLVGHRNTPIPLSNRMLAVPLDAVSSVWRDAIGSWTIAIRGSVQGEDETRARFIPE